MSTYRNEWPCCGQVTETDAWEPSACPFCADDPRIAALESALSAAEAERKEYERKMDYWRDKAKETMAERDALRAAIEVFVEWCDKESAGPQYSHPARRVGPDGEREWRVWWDEQLRLARDSEHMARAAIDNAREGKE